MVQLTDKEIKDLKELSLFLDAQFKAEENGQHEFKCPICGGKAAWGKASGNGHRHAGCTSCGTRMME